MFGNFIIFASFLLWFLFIINPFYAVGAILYGTNFNKKCRNRFLPLPTDPRWTLDTETNDDYSFKLQEVMVWKRSSGWHVWVNGNTYKEVSDSFSDYYGSKILKANKNKNKITNRQIETLKRIAGCDA